MVRQEMVRRFGEENAYTKGYQVYTTVLSNDQEVAQKAVRDNLIAYDMRHATVAVRHCGKRRNPLG